LHHKLCGYVSGPKLSHQGLVFNFTCSSGARARKNCQNLTKTVFSSTNENDKNYTPNSVGMFWVQNRVIRARFSTLRAPMVPGPGKDVKSRLKHFSTVVTENHKNCTQTVWVCFRCKNGSFGLGYQLSLLRACSAGTRARKSLQQSTETLFSRTDGKR